MDKELRGIGEGKEYKPWITIHDVPSFGDKDRILFIKTGREHHFLSTHEEYYYYILEFADNVIDIRE